MNLYSRTLRHIDMNRVKKLHEEKVEHKKLVEKEKERIREELRNLNSPEFSNWRWELEEGMTSSGMFFTTLPATGDLTISSNNFSDGDTSLFNAYVSGNNVVMQHGVAGVDTPIVNANYTNVRQVVTGNIDATKSSDITISINKPVSSFSSWQDRDPAENFDDNIQVVMYSASNPIGSSIELSANFSGTQRFTIPNNLRVSDLQVQFSQFGLMWLPNSPDSGTLDPTISVITTQRTTPVNVFVPLDSPEAISFIRTDPSFANLTPEERKKKLQDMLDASDEYVEKILGSDFPGTGAVPPGEYDPFAQAPPGQAGDTPGVEIAGIGPYGPGNPPPAVPGPGYVWDKHMGEWVPSVGGTGKGANDKWEIITPTPRIPKAQNSPMGQDTQVAAGGNPRNTGGSSSGDPDNIQWPRNNYPNKKAPPGPGYRPPTAKNKQKTMVAHHEPQGNLITERKKKLKSPEEIMNKIPGYYDGKPAPLGFPMEQPPKMKNGMHPDLVDGKKVADRFNRLDPQSAKAMPLTGNPHIDKKVKAARKNPK